MHPRPASRQRPNRPPPDPQPAVEPDDGEPAEVIALPLLARRLPGPPPASLDPVLDATVECVARHGLAKTSLSDIARELGVAPSTVSRKVSSVDNAASLVLARESHRMLERMPEVIAGVEGPRVITVFLAECVASCRRHPLMNKVLRDEVDWVGRLATRRLEESLAESASISEPLLAAAMDAGYVRRQDPAALAHWIARIGMISLLAPPPGDLLAELDRLLLPLLDPAPCAPPSAVPATSGASVAPAAPATSTTSTDRKEPSRA